MKVTSAADGGKDGSQKGRRLRNGAGTRCICGRKIRIARGKSSCIDVDTLQAQTTLEAAAQKRGVRAMAVIFDELIAELSIESIDVRVRAPKFNKFFLKRSLELAAVVRLAVHHRAVYQSIKFAKEIRSRDGIMTRVHPGEYKS